MTAKRSTKRALLLSLLSLITCVTMLVGSTYAWFTDSVTSGSNVIQSGTLDIVLEYWDGTEWVDAEGKVLEFRKASEGAGEEVLWEPGCTYELPKIRVRNEGNLAAKIILILNGIVGDEKLMEAINLTTTITNMPDSVLNGSQGAQLGKFNNATVEPMYGTPDGSIIFDWSLMGKGHTSPNSGHTDTSPEFTIAGHMKEEAGNVYQGLKIEGVSITALAKQEVYEYDSFGREYDRQSTFLNDLAPSTSLTKDESGNWLITSSNDLVYLAQQVNSGVSYVGETILLANDINLKNAEWTPIGTKAKGFSGTFDGQNHTISNYQVNEEEYAGLFGYALNGGNIKNLTVANATVKATDRAGALLGAGYTDVVNCHAIDCEVTVTPALQDNGEYDGGAKAGAVVGQLFEGSGMSIVNCTAKNVKVSGYRDIGAVLGMAHDNNTVTDCKAYDSTVAYIYLEPGQKYDGNTPNENIGEVVGRRNPGVVESGTYFENVTLVKKTEILYDSAAHGGLYEYLPTLNSGDVLVLPAGTYTVGGTLKIAAGVTIKGEAGAEVVFHQISADQDDIFALEGDAIIENITFESNRKGYAITDNTKNHDTDGDITIINCKFKGIAAEKNWGVYKNLNGNLTIMNCSFDNYNNAICGVNNGNGSTTVITGCTFTNIDGEAIGYVASSLPATFESDVINNNTGLTAENVIGY